MSRTDHHNPARVRGHHAHLDGRHTDEDHSPFCENYVGRFGRYGAPGPRPFEIRYVDRELAETGGWTITWESFHGSPRVYARVPRTPHACEIDLVHGRCTRWVDDRDRWPYGMSPSSSQRHDYYYRPERAAVRDALRHAAQEYRGTGEVDTEVPTRQHRHSLWRGGWWD